MLEILKAIRDCKKKIIVLGDTIYDNYIFGEVFRMSPEAPVPILTPNKFEFRLGGAANVFNVIYSLGGNVQLCTLVGNDAEGHKIKNTLIDFHNDPSLIFIDERRKTTKKTRLIKKNGVHLLRIDDEEVTPIHNDLQNRITTAINDVVDEFDILVISDYAKGLITDDLANTVIEIFKNKNKIILTDPKSSNIEKYKNSYLIKPNLYEFMGFIKNTQAIDDVNFIISNVDKILKKSNAEYIYVTLGKKGGLLVGQSIKPKMIPARGNKVVDTTGAGDTVIAAFALAIAADIDIFNCAQFVSYVAGLSVGKVGTSTFSFSELEEFIKFENIKLCL